MLVIHFLEFLHQILGLATKQVNDEEIQEIVILDYRGNYAHGYGSSKGDQDVTKRYRK